MDSFEVCVCVCVMMTMIIGCDAEMPMPWRLKEITIYSQVPVYTPCFYTLMLQC